MIDTPIEVLQHVKFTDEHWDEFTEELSRLLNRHGLDAFCAVPDYILASSVVDHLRNMACTQYAIHIFEESPEWKALKAQEAAGPGAAATA